MRLASQHTLFPSGLIDMEFGSCRRPRVSWNYQPGVKYVKLAAQEINLKTRIRRLRHVSNVSCCRLQRVSIHHELHNGVAVIAVPGICRLSSRCWDWTAVSLNPIVSTCVFVIPSQLSSNCFVLLCCRGPTLLPSPQQHHHSQHIKAQDLLQVLFSTFHNDSAPQEYNRSSTCSRINS